MRSQSGFKPSELGMIPRDWEISKIGDFVDIKHGYAFKGEFFTDIPNENIVVTPGNFNIGGGFKSENLKYTTETCPSGYILNQDDLIVSMTDLSREGDTLGYAAKVPRNFTNKFLHNQRIGLVEFKSKICKEFLYWVLRNKRYNFFIVGSASGTTVKHTSPDTIKEYSFGLPTNFVEQEQIANTLSGLDYKIDVNQEIIKTLESIGKAIFKHWFIDFEFPNEEGKPYKSSGGEMVYNAELGKEIPTDWKDATLNELSDNLDSKRIPLSSRERETRKGVYPYYGATGILDHVDNFIFDGTYVLMGEDGSVIDEEGRPILQYVWGKFWVNNHAHVLKGKMISNELLYLFLRNTRVSHIVTGAVQSKINQGNMNKLVFPLPTQETLPKLENILDPLFRKLRVNMGEIVGLSRIRESLLPKLMSGKIRVPLEAK